MDRKSSINPITEGSINRVPRAIIFDDTSMNKLIQEQCKEVLRLSMNRKDGFKYDEVGRLLRLQNPSEYIDIYGGWDNKSQTCLIKVYENYRYVDMCFSHNKNELIFIHNHPNLSGVSGSDIMSIFEEEAIYAVIAIANNGNVSFAFKNSREYNYMQLTVKITRAIMKKSTHKERAIEQDRIFKIIMENQKNYGLVIGNSRRMQ